MLATNPQPGMAPGCNSEGNQVMTIREISNSDDIIDVRGIIARVEELRANRRHRGKDAMRWSMTMTLRSL